MGITVTSGLKLRRARASCVGVPGATKAEPDHSRTPGQNGHPCASEVLALRCATCLQTLRTFAILMYLSTVRRAPTGAQQTR